MYAADFKIYTHNRPFRLPYAKKHGKTCLAPWDPIAWAELTFSSSAEKEEWFERTIVTGADKEYATVIKPRQPPIAPEQGEEKHDRHREQKQQPNGQEQQPEQLALARQLVSCLSESRSTGSNGWDSWAKVLWAIHTVFGGSEEGRLLAHTFSSVAPNYDPPGVDKIYKMGDGRVGFGSLIVWSKEDSPAVAAAAMDQARFRACLDQWNLTPSAITPLREEGGGEKEEEMEPEPADLRVNANKLDAWWKTYQGGIRERGAKIDAAKAEKNWALLTELAEQLAEFKLHWEQEICGYLNQFMAVITKLPEPAYIEQYGREAHLEKEMVVRKYTNVLGVYRLRGWMKHWINSNERREFDKITFNPKTTQHNKYEFNIFTGLAHQTPTMSKLEATERCQPAIQHITNVWCNGKTDVATFVLSWMAHLVQKPWVKMASALVLRGDEGCGKGVIIKLLKQVLGDQYYYQVQDAEASLFSQFTPANFEQCLLLFVDEAVWGGSRTQAGRLKKLITEDIHEIEHKHGARFSVPSFINAIFASNERWVVPVGYKARRFACLDCNNDKAGINSGAQAYFDQIKDIPIEAFASYLFHVDISCFNPRNVPTTDMLRDQKRRRFNTVAAWWEEVLCKGELVIPYDHAKDLSLERQWNNPIINEEMFAMYNEHKGGDRDVRRPSDLIRELRTLCTFGNEKKTQRWVFGKRHYVTLLPSLEEARLAFCKKVDDPEWFDGEGEEEEEGEEDRDLL
jgi:hypothetical protein